MKSEGLRRSVTWLFAGNVGNQLLTFAAGVVLARLLTPADFGLVVTVNMLTGIAGLIATGGIGQALVRAEHIKKSDIDIIFTINLAISAACFFVLFLFAPYFSQFYGNAIYGDLLRLSAATFLIRPFINIPTSLLNRDMRFKIQAIINVVVLVISSLASISLALLGYGVWSLVWGGLIAAVCNVVISANVARWRPRLNHHFTQAAHFARYGGMVTANNIFVYIRSQTANFLISTQMTAAFLGQYNKADSLKSLPSATISGSIYQVSFRALAKNQSNIPEAKRIFFKSLTIGAFYLFPIYTALFFLAPTFIEFVYGKNWLPAGQALSILALSGYLLIFSNQSGAVIESFGRLKRELRIQTEVWILQILTLAGILWYSPKITHIAAGMVVIIAYNSIRMLSIAISTLGSSWREVVACITPVFILNLTAFGFAWLINIVLIGVQGLPQIAYLLLFSVSYGLGYIAASLFMPNNELKDETKKLLNMIFYRFRLSKIRR